MSAFFFGQGLFCSPCFFLIKFIKKMDEAAAATFSATTVVQGWSMRPALQAPSGRGAVVFPNTCPQIRFSIYYTDQAFCCWQALWWRLIFIGGVHEAMVSGVSWVIRLIFFIRCLLWLSCSSTFVVIWEASLLGGTAGWASIPATVRLLSCFPVVKLRLVHSVFKILVFYFWPGLDIPRQFGRPYMTSLQVLPHYHFGLQPGYKYWKLQPCWSWGKAVTSTACFHFVN